MICNCSSTKDPMLCVATMNDYAEIDSGDRSGLYEVDVNTGVSIWLHVCRDCQGILDAGIEDDGVLGIFRRREDG